MVGEHAGAPVLPPVPYEIRRWASGRRVGRDGHVVWEKNHYSVPYQHVGETVDLRVTSSMLKVFEGGDRLSSHLLTPIGMVNEHRTNDHDLPDDLEVAWASANNKAGGKEKFLRKCASFKLLVLDKCLLDSPDESMRSMLFDLIERRYEESSTVFCTQYPKRDWHQRLGGAVHADAIMDRIVHNAVWVETGTVNMREHAGGPGWPDRSGGERHGVSRGGAHRSDLISPKGNIWALNWNIGWHQTYEYCET